MNDEEKQKNYELAAGLLSEQNFIAAVVVGAVAALLTAVAYGIVVARWPFSYGFAVAGIGIVIGLSMGFLGRGISTKFSVAASVFTIISCVLGNLFRVVMQQALGKGISPIELFRDNSLSTLVEWAFRYVSLIDLVFWFVAAFLAGLLARRSLSRSERLAIGMSELRGKS